MINGWGNNGSTVPLTWLVGYDIFKLKLLVIVITSESITRKGCVMILSLGMGESSYVPDALVGKPRDQVNLDLVAFLQCYARELVQWEVILFFSLYDDWSSPEEVAQALDEPYDLIAKKMAELAETDLIEGRILVTGPLYRLTEGRELRQPVMRLGMELRWAISESL